MRGERLGRLGLPHPGLALQEERLLERERERHHRRQAAIGQVRLGFERIGQLVDRAGLGHGSQVTSGPTAHRRARSARIQFQREEMAASNLDEGHGRRRRAGRRLGYAAGAGPAGDTAAAAAARAVDGVPERAPGARARPPDGARGRAAATPAGTPTRTRSTGSKSSRPTCGGRPPRPLTRRRCSRGRRRRRSSCPVMYAAAGRGQERDHLAHLLGRPEPLHRHPVGDLVQILAVAAHALRVDPARRNADQPDPVLPPLQRQRVGERGHPRAGRRGVGHPLDAAPRAEDDRDHPAAAVLRSSSGSRRAA